MIDCCCLEPSAAHAWSDNFCRSCVFRCATDVVSRAWALSSPSPPVTDAPLLSACIILRQDHPSSTFLRTSAPAALSAAAHTLSAAPLGTDGITASGFSGVGV